MRFILGSSLKNTMPNSRKSKNSPLDISSSRDSAITPFFVSRLRSIILYGFRLCISRTVTKSSLLQLSIVSALVKLGRKFELEKQCTQFLKIIIYLYISQSLANFSEFTSPKSIFFKPINQVRFYPTISQHGEGMVQTY